MKIGSEEGTARRELAKFLQDVFLQSRADFVADASDGALREIEIATFSAEEGLELEEFEAIGLRGSTEIVFQLSGLGLSEAIINALKREFFEAGHDWARRFWIQSRRARRMRARCWRAASTVRPRRSAIWVKSKARA